MDEFLEQALIMKKKMEVILNKAEEVIKNAPEGSLRVNKSREYEQYYLRVNPKDTHGNYISKKNEGLIKQLAQKDYMQKILKVMRVEYRKLNNYLESYQLDKLKEVYGSYSDSRKKLISPIALPDNEFIEMWENQVYTQKKSYDKQERIYTDKGELVKSKSEKIIADKLASMGIPYHYEKPIFINGYGNIYPDFHVLNKRLLKEYIWEHFGMMDTPHYANNAVLKLEDLQKNGYYPGKKLILTFESSEYPLSTQLIDETIAKYLL